MTTSKAIIAGAAIVGIAIVASRLVPSYQFSDWKRINTVTGHVDLCHYVEIPGNNQTANVTCGTE